MEGKCTGTTHEEPDREYQCSLDADTLTIAQKELSECPTERLAAVHVLREWAEQQPNLRCPTDTLYLLSFLRVRHFSQNGARTALQAMWKVRMENTHIFGDINPLDPCIQGFLDMGVFFPLPKPDQHGRTIIFDRPGMLDVAEMKSKYGENILFRTAVCILDWLLMNEQTQVNGIVFISDQSGFKSEQSSVYSFYNLKKAMECFLHTYPARFKEVHIYNMSPLYETVLTMLRPLMSDKLRGRLVVHGKNFHNIYEEIGKQYLPAEYLPDDYTGENQGSLPEIIGKLKEALRKPEVVTYIQNLSSSKYGWYRNLDIPEGQVGLTG
ncbi:hypothetical protein CHS0354_040328 [Potamilus streckersoni]|uniref:CRAL-TRIO domain-containing protein n=1 Tax=Potamilus streckersoni TaxID=2493646 RepID=A0AAE0SG55_9BIVA|nr:hypothetical protein CHS0354_040328 [Potamilus streckersoni]